MNINYHGRKFAGLVNSPDGQVDGETIFQYQQHDRILTAFYSGGLISQGHMLGRVNEDSSLYFVYHHFDTAGNLKSGYCMSTPELMSDGKIRLHESWQWTYGGEGSGQSVIEEIE